MSKLLSELETQEANALALARFFRKQIEAQKKPEKKPDAKILAARQRAQRIIHERFS